MLKARLGTHNYGKMEPRRASGKVRLMKPSMTLKKGMGKVRGKRGRRGSHSRY